MPCGELISLPRRRRPLPTTHSQYLISHRQLDIFTFYLHAVTILTESIPRSELFAERLFYSPAACLSVDFQVVTNENKHTQLFALVTENEPVTGTFLVLTLSRDL